MRKPVVGVMGGSKATRKVAQMAERLGELIAKQGWILLNGGRDRGVMQASARGAKNAGGTVIGILPDKKITKKVSPDLDVAVLTGMGDARNVINVLSSDVVIACPGSLGTLSEIVLALKSKKRVILLGYSKAPSELKKFHKRGQLSLADEPDEAIEQAAASLRELDIG